LEGKHYTDTHASRTQSGGQFNGQFSSVQSLDLWSRRGDMRAEDTEDATH